MAFLLEKDHDEHASRFANQVKANYGDATLKVMLIIGADKDLVTTRLEQITGIPGLEAVGLVVSQAHDCYEVLVKPDSSQPNVEGPVLFVCDRVAKSLQLRDGRLRISSAQSLQDFAPKKRLRTAGATLLERLSILERLLNMGESNSAETQIMARILSVEKKFGIEPTPGQKSLLLRIQEVEAIVQLLDDTENTVGVTPSGDTSIESRIKSLESALDLDHKGTLIACIKKVYEAAVG